MHKTITLLVAVVCLMGWILLAVPRESLGEMGEGGAHKGMMKAKHPKDHHHKKGETFFLDRKQELDLTAEQVQKLRELKNVTEERELEDRKALKKMKGDLHKLLEQEAVDITAVDAILDEMGKLKTNTEKGHIRARLEARNLLTAQQREKLKEPKGHGKPSPEQE